MLKITQQPSYCSRETYLIYFCPNLECFVLGIDYGDVMMESNNISEIIHYCARSRINYKIEGCR